MAGHSKYKNIMHRKGSQDKKRARKFSRLAKEISVAVKIGGLDPDNNTFTYIYTEHPIIKVLD